MSNLVEKGNLIEFYLEPKESTKIEWQQNFAKHKENFMVVAFNVVNSEVTRTLFIAQKKAKEFMNKAEKSTNENPLFDAVSYTTTVDDDFQYGQDADKTIRFLVFHDKNEKMYQHRFVSTNAFQNVATAIGEKVDKIESIKKYLDKIMSLGKAYIGDPLRSF